MRYRRRFSSRFSCPQEYADRLADAMGEGFDAESARTYAGGSGSLRWLLPPPRDARDEDQEETEESAEPREEDKRHE
jgi:hypothetical protein